MTSNSLVHAANSGQQNPITFSLTFHRNSWSEFWRLLALGCVMSDYILDNDIDEMHHIAKMWDKLSVELARAIHECRIDADGGVVEAKHT